jgi:hypothetical protein
MRIRIFGVILAWLVLVGVASAQVPVVGNQGVVALPPSGAIFFITSGTCPAGTTQAADLVGKTLFGTSAANADVGGTGGSDSITPAGTIAYPANVPGFTGTALGNHKHSVTAAGTVAWPSAPTNVPTYTWAIGTLAISNHTSVSSKQGSAAGNVVTTNTHSFTGSAGGTIAWPAKVPVFSGSAVDSADVSAGTPAGSVAWPANPPTLSGTSFDNRSAYIKVIFCRVD